MQYGFSHFLNVVVCRLTALLAHFLHVHWVAVNICVVYVIRMNIPVTTIPLAQPTSPSPAPYPIAIFTTTTTTTMSTALFLLFAARDDVVAVAIVVAVPNYQTSRTYYMTENTLKFLPIDSIETPRCVRNLSLGHAAWHNIRRHVKICSIVHYLLLLLLWIKWMKTREKKRLFEKS